MMKSLLTSAFLSILCFHSVFPQDTITYNVYFPNAAQHEAEITLKLENIDRKELTVRMSNSSPGRYAMHNFGKNIYNLKSFDDDNKNISITKIAPDAWKLNELSGAINISYTLYANHADGTYSGIDEDFANLNIPATFLWVQGMEQNPVKVIFNIPDTSSWKIATQLHEIDSTNKIYSAPAFQYFMDSPVILSSFHLTDIDAGFDQQIRMAINSEIEAGEIDKFSEMTQKVIHEQKAIFGELPQFYDSTYTFLCSYGPGFYGDGMEHRNSTMISSPTTLKGNQSRMIGTISHEFFHIWNIERIRPKSLEPFDFTKANMSGELWFGEGFTSYYGELVLCRAGILSADRYINSISGKINYFVNAPGWKYGSPVHMSEMAPYADRAAANDEVNFSNTYLSYYVYGEMVALALDLSLRTQFKDVTLDDFMRAMWNKFGKDEISYTNMDLQNTLAEICGDAEFTGSFFKTHIFGNELPDFESLFDKLGYRLIKKNPDKPSLGFLRLKFKGDTATLVSQPLVGKGLYEAGLNKGDLILSIDEQVVTSYPELNFIIGTRKVGDELSISFSHFGKLKKSAFKLQEDNQLVLIPKEKFSIKIKEEEKKLRANWLKSKVSLK